MNHSFIRNQLTAYNPNTDIVRGDHDLYPGMGPDGHLTSAAVLVPLILHDNITALFTQRAKRMSKHSGQISFPGGHVDDEDVDAEATALRETEEEVGINSAHIETIGRLDTYVIRTGFLVTPVVGFLMPPFVVTPDNHEVDEVFEVPLSFLMDHNNHQRHKRELNGQNCDYFAIPYEGRYIWGATAGMLVNLYDILMAPLGDDV
jgi:8-oxo-dGTP pyrophosphatase MutT (NUDIX family)